MEPLTIFMHMPKTGGSTLNGIVRRLHDSDRLYATPEVIINCYGNKWKQIPAMERWQYARDFFGSLPESKKSQLDGVFGHLWFGWHELTERSCQYVTFLRHPVRHFISYYNYMKGRQEHPVGKKIQAENLNLKEFMADQDLSELPDNQQTKFITGNFDPRSETLEQATKNIEDQFLYVGLTEHFDADLLRLSELLDWPQPYYTKRNTSRDHVSLGDLDAGIVRKILERNQLDMALYEFVKARRDSQSELRMRVFQTLNSLRDTSIVQHLRRIASTE